MGRRERAPRCGRYRALLAQGAKLGAFHHKSFLRCHQCQGGTKGHMGEGAGERSRKRILKRGEEGGGGRGGGEEAKEEEGRREEDKPGKEERRATSELSWSQKSPSVPLNSSPVCPHPPLSGTEIPLISHRNAMCWSALSLWRSLLGLLHTGAAERMGVQESEVSRELGVQFPTLHSCAILASPLSLSPSILPGKAPELTR